MALTTELREALSATKLSRLQTTPEEAEELFRVLETAICAYPDFTLEAALWHITDPEKYPAADVGDGLAVFLATEIIETCSGNHPSRMPEIAREAMVAAQAELQGVLDSVDRLADSSHILRYAVPEDLCPTGRKAVDAITRALLINGDPGLGGCTPWYSPDAWRKRGESDPGPSAVLVVVHDGGGLSHAFNLDKEYYRLYDQMQDALKAAGLWCEHINSWSTAIYKIPS